MTRAPLTLRALLAHADLFIYPQTWYLDEAFLNEPLPDDAPRGTPNRIVCRADAPSTIDEIAALPLAVTVVAAYLRDPFNPIWQNYIWCRDTDARQQRIFVGGVKDPDYPKLEIHRHLHLTAQWGVPIWT